MTVLYSWPNKIGHGYSCSKCLMMYKYILHVHQGVLNFYLGKLAYCTTLSVCYLITEGGASYCLGLLHAQWSVSCLVDGLYLLATVGS